MNVKLIEISISPCNSKRIYEKFEGSYKKVGLILKITISLEWWVIKLINLLI